MQEKSVSFTLAQLATVYPTTRLKNILEIYQQHAKSICKHVSKIYQKYVQIYLRYNQDMQGKYKDQAAAGPAQAHGRARAGPGPAPLWAWAGPAAAWCLVFIWYILSIFGI